MRIVQRDPRSLTPYPDNPRQNEEAVAAVAASIQQFGFRQPIVVDTQGIIVVGHTRWKAALRLGLAKVPVHVADDLTPEQARAYRVADNRLAELSDWDSTALARELAAINGEGAQDWGQALGYSEAEVARLMKALEPPPEAPAQPKKRGRTGGSGPSGEGLVTVQVGTRGCGLPRTLVERLHAWADANYPGNLRAALVDVLEAGMADPREARADSRSARSG